MGKDDWGVGLVGTSTAARRRFSHTTHPTITHNARAQVKVMELPCIAHTLAEGHASLAAALDTGGFDYVVITSPEVSNLWGCNGDE